MQRTRNMAVNTARFAALNAGNAGVKGSNQEQTMRIVPSAADMALSWRTTEIEHCLEYDA